MSDHIPCTPVPCPSFQDVELTVTAICDCQEFYAPGNPDCPIHGNDVRAWLDGLNAAIDLLNDVIAEFKDRRDQAALAENHNFHAGWNTAMRSFDLGFQAAVDKAPRVGESE